MRYTEFVTERKKSKKKRSKKLRNYFFPGYGYYGMFGSGEDSGGGDGGGGESINENPEIELAKRLPSLKKHDTTTIDDLVRKVAYKHKITNKALEDLFKRKYRKTPTSWFDGKLDEQDVEPNTNVNLEQEVNKFVEWTKNRLNLKSDPVIELSYDTEDAQNNHHTGSHTDGENKVWVYVKNRNLVDILRTIFHELVHVRQGELDMIRPGASYPGSPIEVMADALAGKYIKIYGEKNHHIFQ
jgi:hypothetical protein